MKVTPGLRAILTLAVILLWCVAAGLTIVILDAPTTPDAEPTTETITPLTRQLADELQIALDSLVACELRLPGHIVFPTDTATRIATRRHE